MSSNKPAKPLLNRRARTGLCLYFVFQPALFWILVLALRCFGVEFIPEWSAWAPLLVLALIGANQLLGAQPVQDVMKSAAYLWPRTPRS